MRPTTAFRALTANRRAAVQREAEALPFVVRAVNKGGGFSKSRPDARDYAATYEEAAKRAADLMAMNPGRVWRVCNEGGDR
jgi:hypothetical protein